MQVSSHPAGRGPALLRPLGKVQTKPEVQMPDLLTQKDHSEAQLCLEPWSNARTGHFPGLPSIASVVILTSHPEQPSSHGMAAASRPARLGFRGTQRRSWGWLVWASGTDGDGHRSRTDSPALRLVKARLSWLSVFLLPYSS